MRPRAGKTARQTGLEPSAEPPDQAIAASRSSLLRMDGRMAGYGVIRRCGKGCKIGPLFADDAAGAEALFQSLSAFTAGDTLILDAPENQAGAQALVKRHGMSETFGCARMYLGGVPELVQERVFGVTSFELG